MVCPRCVMAVEEILHKIGLEETQVSLGEATLFEEISTEQLESFKKELISVGFELLDDKQKQLIEKIKMIIISSIADNQKKLSELITTEVNKDYSYLSKLFSTTEGVTIEQYTIIQKIEKAKELLTYNQLTLSEIAFKLSYSSVAHLSAQFKKITGLTPTQFKSQGIHLRISLDSI